MLAEVSGMSPTTGRVAWPVPLEPYDQFFARVMSHAYEQRDGAEAQRAAYMAEVDARSDQETAALDIERQAELDALGEDMKSWPEEHRRQYREVIGSIAQGLRDKTLQPDQIGDFINRKFK